MNAEKIDFRNRDIRRVITHVCPDLDAISSVWFFMRFIAKKQLDVKFVPASWDGHDMSPHDVALDIDAGGRGLKGRRTFKGQVHSCFKFLVEKYANNETRMILKPLVKFIDRNDTYGGVNKVGDFSKNKNHQITAFIALSLALKAFRAVHNSDPLVFERMSELLDGVYKINKDFIKNQKDVLQKSIVVGKTIILPEGGNGSSRGFLFKKGYEALVYVDGNNIGLLTSGGLRANSPEVMKVIASAGESSEWFVHSAGYLVARGTRKDPRETGSSVDPYKLATAIETTRKRLEVEKNGKQIIKRK